MIVLFLDEPSTITGPTVVFAPDGKLLLVSSLLLLEDWWADMLKKTPFPPPSHVAARLDGLEADSWAELIDLAPGMPEDWSLFVYVAGARGCEYVQAGDVRMPVSDGSGLVFGVSPDTDVSLHGVDGWLIEYPMGGPVGTRRCNS
jgi:hypothetical protein